MAVSDRCVGMTRMRSVSSVPEAILRTARVKIDRSAQNKLWLLDHMEMLRSKYPDKYIAYDQGKILAVGESSREVIVKLRRKKVKDTSVVAVEFVSKEPVIWLL